MNRALLTAALVAALAPQAWADQSQAANANANSGSASQSTSYGNVGNSTTNVIAPTSNNQTSANSHSSTSSNSNASNAGNSQNITFNTTMTVEQINAAAKAQRELEAGRAADAREMTTLQGAIAQDLAAAGTTTRVEYSGTQTIKNVPSVNGPPLTTSNDTCMGSTSGSINGPGFGIGLGSTWQDKNCVMLKNAREMWNMGMKAAAMALICTDPANRMALEITGFECPQTARARIAEEHAQRATVAARHPRPAAVPAEVWNAPVGSFPPGLPGEPVAPQAAAPLGAGPQPVMQPVALQVPAAPEPAVSAAKAPESSVVIRRVDGGDVVRGAPAAK
jgi:hypothetical protein